MQKKSIYFYAKTLLLAVLAFSLTACDEDEELVEYADGGFVQIADPLLRVNTPVVSFQAGTDQYEYSIDFVNGLNSVKTLNVYIIYSDAVLMASSERTLFESVEITNDIKQVYERTFSYDDLKSGITVNSNPLPEDDRDLAIGSNWVLSFEGVTASGDIIRFAPNVTVGVLSRFAGLYKALNTAYYRIGVISGLTDWSGSIRFIGSVDDNTFSHPNYWGPFDWQGAQFNFDINFSTNKITVPILTNDGLFSGDKVLTCTSNAGEMPNVPCGSNDTNKLVPNDATGKHKIFLTYGYSSSGGAREFYEELEKIVD